MASRMAAQSGSGGTRRFDVPVRGVAKEWEGFGGRLPCPGDMTNLGSP